MFGFVCWTACLLVALAMACEAAARLSVSRPCPFKATTGLMRFKPDPLRLAVAGVLFLAPLPLPIVCPIAISSRDPAERGRGASFSLLNPRLVTGLAVPGLLGGGKASLSSALERVDNVDLEEVADIELGRTSLTGDDIGLFVLAGEVDGVANAKRAVGGSWDLEGDE